MGVLRRLNLKGDAETHWDKDDPESTAKAKAKFEALIEKSALCFALDRADGPATQITTFRPEVEEILIVPQIRGGN